MFGMRNLLKLTSHVTKSNFTGINTHEPILLQTLSNHSVISRMKDTHAICISHRLIMCSASAAKHSDESSSATHPTPNIGEYDTLTEYHAYDMIHKLSDNDRASLLKALNKYNSDKIKTKFQGEFSVW